MKDKQRLLIQLILLHKNKLAGFERCLNALAVVNAVEILINPSFTRIWIEVMAHADILKKICVPYMKNGQLCAE